MVSVKWLAWLSRKWLSPLHLAQCSLSRSPHWTVICCVCVCFLAMFICFGRIVRLCVINPILCPMFHFIHVCCLLIWWSVYGILLLFHNCVVLGHYFHFNEFISIEQYALWIRLLYTQMSNWMMKFLEIQQFTAICCCSASGVIGEIFLLLCGERWLVGNDVIPMNRSIRVRRRLCVCVCYVKFTGRWCRAR